VREVSIELRSDGPPLGPGASGGRIERDYHVAQERPIPRRIRLREGQHVRGAVHAPPLPVEGPDGAVGDERDRQLRLRDGQRSEELPGAAPQAPRGRGAPRVVAGQANGHGFATRWTGGGGRGSWEGRPGYSGRVW